MTKPELIAERKRYGVNKVAMDYTMKIFETLDDNIVLIDGVKYQRMVNETPKPPTLYDTLAPQMNAVGFHFNEQQRGWICDTVRNWLIDHTLIETEDAEIVTFTIHKEQLQTPK